MKMTSTKKQCEELRNCHIGVGFLIMHTKENTVAEVEVYFDRHGRLCNLNDGQPITPESLGIDRSNGDEDFYYYGHGRRGKDIFRIWSPSTSETYFQRERKKMEVNIDTGESQKKVKQG